MLKPPFFTIDIENFHISYHDHLHHDIYSYHVYRTSLHLTHYGSYRTVVSFDPPPQNLYAHIDLYIYSHHYKLLYLIMANF